MRNAVGVLGGVGPLATVYFMEMIIEMTDASKDQEHIDMLVSNHATIPDRTGFILGELGIADGRHGGGRADAGNGRLQLRRDPM